MDKKDMVIKAARELFSKHGYRKVSMDEIAKKANVTKKTIYSYFKDKDSMFKFFIQEELEQMKEIIEKNKKKNKNFINLVSVSIYDTLVFRKNSILFSSILNEFNNENSEKCNGFIKFYDNEIIKYIENKIEEEINLGNIKKCNAHLAAFIIYKIYLAVMFEYDKEIDENEVTQEVTSILKDGLLN